MSTIPPVIAPAATIPPAAKDVPPPPPPSIADKVAAAFQMSPPPPVPGAAVPPNPATPPKPDPAATPPAPVAKVSPTLLPKKTVKSDAPVTSDDPDAKFTLSDTATDEQKSQWTQLKQTARERYNKIKELESKVNAPAVPTAEVERLRKEHKEALDRIALLDIRSHPDFKRQFEEPRTKALAEVAEILAFSDKGDVDLQGLITKPLKDFNTTVSELTKNMDAMSATTVQTALRQAYRLAQDEKVALSKSGELYQQTQQQEMARAKQVFDEVSSNLGQMGEFLTTLDLPDGATPEEKAEIETYNQAVSSIRQNVEQVVFGKTNERSMATLGWKAGTLDFLLQHGIPRMEKNYAALVESHNALAAELEAIKGSKGSGPVSGDPAKGGTKPMSIEEQVKAAYRTQ